MRIDLHTHTNCSDGSFSPLELIDHANSLEISTIAITDHDTVDGCSPAKARGKEVGVRVINGVELSIDYPLDGNGHLHLVGLFIDSANENLLRVLDRLKNARKDRAEEILHKLAKIGMPLEQEELDKKVNGATPGRPHIVSLMMKKGYIRSPFQGYTRFLGKGNPAYVPKKKLNIETAINLIHEVGGLAIVAHPISLMCANYPRLGDEILKFQNLGLDGVEVYYPSHDRYFSRWLFDFCRKHHLVISGGSDFHGKAKPDIELGRGRGNINISDQVLNEMEAYRDLKMS